MKNQQGFTLPELLVAVALFMTVAGVAIALLGSAAISIRSDSQAGRLLGLIQLARETAIMRQRDVEIAFDEDTDTVTLVRFDDGVAVPLQQLSFEHQVGFRQYTGAGDTPEGYGDGSPVDFGTAARLIFIPDGSLVDEANVPVNGTVYLGMLNRPETARAVTLTGTTARARLYRWAPETAAWEGGWVTK